MEGWRAREWVHSLHGTPDVDMLLQLVGGHQVVSVTDTTQQQEGCGRVLEVPLADYMRWWQQRKKYTGKQEEEEKACVHAAHEITAPCVRGGQPGDKGQHLGDSSASSKEQERGSGLFSSDGQPQGHWYLKDWHFVAQAREGYKVSPLNL